MVQQYHSDKSITKKIIMSVSNYNLVGQGDYKISKTTNHKTTWSTFEMSILYIEII